MLQTIGFIAVTIMLIGLSGIWCFFALVGLGKYNLGGVPNSFAKQAFIWTAGALIGWGWYVWAHSFSFSFSLS